MEKALYFSAPIEGVKVTAHNMDEVAAWCGGRVCKTERKTEPGSFDNYIWVPTPKGASVFAAYPGMYITKRVTINIKGAYKTMWAVFFQDYFEKNYFQNPVDAVEGLRGSFVNHGELRRPRVSENT